MQAPEAERADAPDATVPGPDGVPILGVLPQFARDPLSLMWRSAREYGPVVRWEFPRETSYLVTDPEAIERVLVRENQQYAKGERFQQSLRPVLGEGLLTSEGETWRRQRHRIEPAFHPDALARYAHTMVERTEARIDGWRDGETIELHDAMMGLTLEIVAEALFGVDVRDRVDEVGEALAAVTAHAERVRTDYVPLWVPTPLNLRFHRAKRALDAIVADIVEERWRDPGDDVVSALLAATDEAGDRMSIDQLHDEVLTLLLAGHETTALALTYAFFAIAQRPGVEARLHEEVDDVLGDGGAIPGGRGDGSVDGRYDGGDDATVADRDESGDDAPPAADPPDLPYAERVVRETLRLYPPVYAILREPTRDVELAGYEIPAGSTLTLSQFVVHRDPSLYDDPATFRPDRWADSLAEALPRFGYFPFAGGPRRCVGDRFALLEAQLVLATIARRYRLELVSSPSLSFAPGITMRPAEPVRVRVHER